MTKKRIAINGFGRIGRAAARIIMMYHQDTIELVAINDPSDDELTAHLFQFDSNYGTFPLDISIDKGVLLVGEQKIQKFSTRNIEELPWGDLNVDIVLECTGVFRTADTCQKHIDQGAKKVLLSAPAKSDGFKTVVLGVNDDIIETTDTLISNASCTTNCLAPVVKVLDENFGVVSGFVTTIHSYTNDQRILDVGHKDFRRARAADVNIIPTTTGAAKAVGIVYPKLAGKLDGMAVRVPTPTVSLIDLVVQVENSATAAEVNKALEQASNALPHVIGFETRPLVSRDYVGDSRSTIIDADQTKTMNNTVKVFAWYDNEWGYSCRLVELAENL
jgi:glyceraldehyde 3-phosphate dehydrogenase